MRSSLLLDKAFMFATKVVMLHEELSQKRRDMTLFTQLLRSATSVGANLSEAAYAQSKADFISKLHIALKETSEAAYWLRLIQQTAIHNTTELSSQADELIRLLTASLKTAKLPPPNTKQ